jgi:uncharacterized spore protein YtfJ
MSNTKLKVAALTTIYHPNSHADVIVSRWLQPRDTDIQYGWSGQRSEIASLYIAQFPPHTLWENPSAEQRALLKDHDLGRYMAQKFEVPLFTSIRDALTQGTDELSVDAVLLIGEHGTYPYNEIGQKMYPRREMFDEVVAVFREAGRVVPIFIDKHYSYDTDSALYMVQTAQELGIPLFAGSSLPYSGFCDDVPMPESQVIEEAVSVFCVGVESYGFHSLEMMQSVIERREGGEHGIRSIRAFVGQSVWDAIDRGEISASLVEAAIGQCRKAATGNMRENCQPNNSDDGYGCPISPVAFLLEHSDGLRNSHLMLHGHLEEFSMALRTKSDQQIYAGCSQVNTHTAEDFFAHFATLCSLIEEFFITGKLPVAPERTLLTTLTLAAVMKAIQEPGLRIATPLLEIAYQPV